MYNEQENLCLNIGCGLDAPDEWLNIDASPGLRLSKIPLLGGYLQAILKLPAWPKSVRYGDLIKGLNIRQESCGLIFASHILEHLSLSDFQTAVNNIYLYLKPGGILRAIVPDLEKLAAVYAEQLKDGSLSAQSAHNFIKTSGIGCENSRKHLSGRIREAFSNSRHQWLWDEMSLSYSFKQQGFSKIRRCKYGDWSDPMFGLVENQARHENAVCIEAIK